MLLWNGRENFRTKEEQKTAYAPLNQPLLMKVEETQA
jgi:hypothetical protein